MPTPWADTSASLVMIATFTKNLDVPSSQRGDTLIEVLIGAMIVALIAVGTLTGFDSADSLSAQQREHNEAATLTAQSQEQLRTDPASILETLGSTGHSYIQTIGGTAYTVKQTAELLPASGSNATCNVTQTKRQSGNAFQITSTVSWHQQEASHRKTLTSSSVITPPTGSAIEVDVDNAPVATSGVSGVTAVITYTPVESSSNASVSSVTGAEGCIVFGGIPATSAIVEINEVPGYVTVSGASQYPTKELTIAPNYTTHDEVIYNAAGAITAEFTYAGKSEREHANNEGATGASAIHEKVTGDTFVALNTKMNLAPDFEVGSTTYGSSAVAPYEPEPGTYATSATTESNLFPFTSTENSYSVYAGDCTENNPEIITSKAVTLQEPVVVNPRGTTAVAVPMSYVTVNAYKATESAVNALGTSKWKDLETTNPLPITITNKKCAGVTPDNEKTIADRHLQSTTTNATSPANGGHLTYPFQPFGTFEACVYSSTEKKTYKTEYTNSSVAGSTVNIYLPAPTGTTGGVKVATASSNTC
jgi:type II secretory pathway pseudopilin PulG